MATITIDALNLFDLYVAQVASGQYQVRAAFSLLSGGQVVVSLNQDVTARLDSSDLSALGSAFSNVAGALAAQIATL